MVRPSWPAVTSSDRMEDTDGVGAPVLLMSSKYMLAQVTNRSETDDEVDTVSTSG